MNTQRAVKAKIDDRINAARYRKLRAWLISAGRFRATDTNCGAADAWFFGPTLDAAVDALPESKSAGQQEIA